MIPQPNTLVQNNLKAENNSTGNAYAVFFGQKVILIAHVFQEALRRLDLSGGGVSMFLRQLGLFGEL